MAAPNIAALTTITGKTTYFTPTGTTPVVLLANAAGSNKVFKVNVINAANIDGTNPFNATVALYTNGAVAQGGAPSGGTAYNLASTVAVPANAALIVVDGSTGFYLEEGMSVIVTSSGASKLTFIISYEDMS